MKYYNHTPGPWRVNQSCGPGLTDIQIWRPHPKTGLYVFIANAGPDVPATEPQERLANAYLIAAAPELLEALELLVSEISNGDDISKSLRIAAEIIAKARGE